MELALAFILGMGAGYALSMFAHWIKTRGGGW
jgi:hypothetical protein